MRGSQGTLSVRTIGALLLAGMGVAGLAIVAASLWHALLLEETSRALIRDARSMELITESELNLLAYHQMANVELLSVNPEARSEAEVARGALEREVRNALRRAQEFSASENELDLLRQAAAHVDVYLEQRRGLEADGPPLDAVLRGARDSLQQAVAAIDLVRTLNESEVERAYQNAQQAGRNLRLASVGVSAIGIVVLAALTSWTRYALLRPIVTLRNAIGRHRDGRWVPVVDRGMPRELAEIAAELDAMNAVLVRRREDQMAFLAGVAHELRNPLNALRASCAVLRATVGHNGGPALAVLERQLAHLNRMVDDLLDIGRIEGGKLVLNVTAVDLCSIVRSVTELYGSTATRHELRSDLPPEPVRVDADPVRIEQVLGNLLSNAVKYSPEGGVVTIRVRGGEHEAVMSVTDQGIGIRPAELGELFQPFRRTQRANGVPGAGLGLSIVQRIVKAHGGKIDVQSAVGGGSTFTVRLPRRMTAGEPQ